MPVLNRASGLQPEVAEWRRHLHQNPELLFDVHGTAAFVAFIARSTNRAYTATQFALFTSLAAVPRTLVNASAGWLVEQLGWYGFFWLCAFLAIPGMLLLFKVAPWSGDKQPAASEAAA